MLKGDSGLEADQKVIAAHGCYAMTATTALTAQNTQGVLNIFHTPSNFVKQQIDACTEDIGVDVVKIGRSRPGLLTDLSTKDESNGFLSLTMRRHAFIHYYSQYSGGGFGAPSIPRIHCRSSKLSNPFFHRLIIILQKSGNDVN